jgi:hypothetical protein
MASTYLSKTLSTPTNNKIWTYSAWLKLASAGSATESPLSSGTDANNRGIIYFNGGNNEIQYYEATSGTTSIHLTTNRLFRDISAWYHIVLSVDTTQATDSDRVKIYVNGVQETSLATATYPTLDYNTKINSAVNMSIGSANSYGGALHFSGSMAHVHFIDGIAISASPFGETDTTTGIWKPKTAPTVTYGTNGFFLKFENSASFGTDSSPNGNNFTVNGTMTQTIDTPSNVFATLNPLRSIGGNVGTYSTGNTTYTASPNDWQGTVGTLGATSGKWYWEWKVLSTNNNISGIVSDIAGASAATHDAASVVGGFGGYIDSGNFHARFAESDISGWDTASVGVSFTTNDIVNVALDMDNKFLYFGKNGTWMKSGVPTSGATGTGGIDIGTPYDTVGLFAIPAVSIYGTGASGSINFGNGVFGSTPLTGTTYSDTADLGIFKYEVPAGYYALCTKNINTQEYN